MIGDKSVAVVVPCYNEKKQIGRVLETLPEFVDLAIVVDDHSPDGTAEFVRAQVRDRGWQDRVVVLRHKANQGVGAAIATGYREVIRRQIDVAAVMAGDGQMDPEELHVLVGIVARGEADYAKGNRLFYRGAWQRIPKHRYLGNAFLSMLTKIASGYWHVADSQSGYTAISLEALETIPLAGVYPRYGYPNDLLVRLNVYEMRVADVPTRPVYGVGEQSKMKIWKVVPTVSYLILRRFLWRLKARYIVHDFHPLILFFAIGSLLFGGGLGLGLYLLYLRLGGAMVAGTSSLFSALLLISGLQLLLFAMWLDMEMNRHLRVDVRAQWRSLRRAQVAAEAAEAEAETVAAQPASAANARADGEAGDGPTAAPMPVQA